MQTKATQEKIKNTKKSMIVEYLSIVRAKLAIETAKQREVKLTSPMSSLMR